MYRIIAEQLYEENFKTQSRTVVNALVRLAMNLECLYPSV